MEPYKMMLLLAIIFGSLALFFSTMAIFHLCTSDDEGVKDYFCKGTIYDGIRTRFGVNKLEHRRDTLQILSHVFALTFGIGTVIMSGVGLCTDCSSNKGFMICNVILAALAFFFMLTAAAVRSVWYRWFTVDDPEAYQLDHDPLPPDLAARLYRGRVNMTMFWTSVILFSATFVFVLIATIMVTCGNKK